MSQYIIMGHSDRYCIICGGPLIKVTRDYLLEWYDEEIEELEYSDETDKKDKILIEKLKKDKDISDKYNWLNKLYFITEENKLIVAEGDKSIEWHDTFIKKGVKYKADSYDYYYKNKRQKIIVCHRKCYKLLKKELDIVCCTQMLLILLI